MKTVEKKTATQIKSSARKADKSAMFFYEGGGRSKILNQILHCVKFSSGVIVLTGPTGSGRSLLLQTFAQSFNSSGEGDLCVLSEDSMVLESEEELYRALAHGFGLEEKSVELLEDLVDRVQHFIRVGLRGKQNLLIAVDDAKQHSLDVLEILLQLAGSNKGLSLLLVGESGFLETLKQFHTQSLLMHHISLRPLLTEEAFDFVRQYLQKQGVSDETALSRKKFDELMSKTGGNLSLLVRESSQLVLNLQLKTAREPSSLPIAHMFALVVVITLTALAFLYYPGSNDVSPSVVASVVPSVPQTQIDKQKTTNMVSTVKASEPAKLPDNAPEIPQIDELSTTTKVDMPNDNSVPLGQQNEQKTTEPLQSIIIEDPLYQQPVEPASKSVKNFSQSKSAFSSQEQELLSRLKTNVTLQIANLSSEKAAKTFISRLTSADQKQVHYYRRSGKDGDSYIVLYGDYLNKPEAMSAQKMLPAYLKKASPWPRTLAEVQRELVQH